jgi:hypothetical protein
MRFSGGATNFVVSHFRGSARHSHWGLLNVQIRVKKFFFVSWCLGGEMRQNLWHCPVLHPGGGWPFPTALDFLISHISLWLWRAVRREYPQN